jgi:hypothetical protein
LNRNNLGEYPFLKKVGVKRIFGGVEVNARIVNFEVLAGASQIDCFEGLFRVL